MPAVVCVGGHDIAAVPLPIAAERLTTMESHPMIKSLTVKIAAWRRYRDSVRELSRLSDRELNDLGIGRADIQSLVRQSTAAQA